MELILFWFGPAVALAVVCGLVQRRVLRLEGRRAALGWLLPVLGTAATAVLLYKAETADGFFLPGLDYLIYGTWAAGAVLGSLFATAVHFIKNWRKSP